MTPDVVIDRLTTEFIQNTTSKLMEKQVRIDSVIRVWKVRLTDGEIAGLVESTGTIRISTDAMMNDILKGFKENVTTAAQIGREDAKKEKPQKRQMWQTSGADNVCPDCRERSGQIHTVDYWESVGTPDMPVTICGSNCKCALVDVPDS